MIRQGFQYFVRSAIFGAGFGAAAVLLAAAALYGQTQLTEPVYRVAQQSTAQANAQPAAIQAAVTPAPAVQPAASVPAAASTPFDLTARPGEHPLAPVIRVCKASMEHMDRNVADYSCLLVKQERLEDEAAVGEKQYIDLRVRHQPFSVHMSFRQPHTGRKVVWVNGLNDNKLTVREGGLLGLIKVDFLPDSPTAMSGQKYPIYKIGIRNLLAELTKHFEADTKYLESEVTINPKAEVQKRSATLIQVTHPVPRQNFRSHISRIYFDNELKIPIYYDAYMWPAKEGDPKPMEESFAYTNLKVNNGFTARDFDKENAENFK